jgi:hypothetical protein
MKANPVAKAQPKLLTREEARRIAVNIGKLPQLLTRPEPESRALAELWFEFFQFPIAAHPS